MSRLMAWLKGFNVSTHTIAAIAGVLGTAYAGDAAFRDEVNSIYHRLSPLPQAVIGVSIFLFGLYKRGALGGFTMPSDQVFCPRCGKLGVAADSATEHLVYCPSAHGLILKAPLPQQSAEVATDAAPELPAPKPKALN